MLNNFIYDVAEAEGIDYIRPFTNVHKTGVRRVKLWYLYSGFSMEKFEKLKRVLERAVPGIEVKYKEAVGPWTSSSINIYF